MGTKNNETVKKKSKDEIMKDNQIILDLYDLTFCAGFAGP